MYSPNIDWLWRATKEQIRLVEKLTNERFNFQSCIYRSSNNFNLNLFGQSSGEVYNLIQKYGEGYALEFYQKERLHSQPFCIFWDELMKKVRSRVRYPKSSMKQTQRIKAIELKVGDEVIVKISDSRYENRVGFVSKIDYWVWVTLFDDKTPYPCKLDEVQKYEEI